MTIGRLRKRRTLIVGMVVAATVGVAAYLATQAHKGLPWDDRTVVHAEFADVSGLRIGDDVRIASARVGSVKGIELVDGTPRVTMQLSDQRPIYRNARAEARTASVSSRSLLGQKYVNLIPGSPSAGPLGPKDVIARGSTTEARDVNTLLDDVFDESTREAAGSVLREVGGGLGGHARDLNDAVEAAPEMLPQLGAIARALSTEDGADMAALLASAERLSGRFEGRQQHIAGLLRGFRTTMDAVGVDEGAPLRGTLERGPSTLRTTREAMRSLQEPLADLQAGMGTMRTGARALGEATPDLRGVLREGTRPLQKMPAVNKQAEPAVSDLTAVVEDARPLAPRAVQMLDRSHSFLNVLAPYAPEVSTWFTNWAGALSHKDENGHYLRLSLLFSEESVAGQGGIKSPLVDRKPYPAPGEAAKDRSTLSTGGEG
ncbi:MlaD family protein [Haloechinothrix salitolerans]|uniref:MlaD family protein n=1 Tax=Haloechinothrix salitolerans TaxID=926830 RepID=A0ABW2BUF3_9PSEU